MDKKYLIYISIITIVIILIVGIFALYNNILKDEEAGIRSIIDKALILL